jgi:hypothetical protein
MAEADQQFRHFISAETVVSALSLACAAPLTTKDARRRLKGYGDGAIGIVIMRPCEAAARRRDTGVYSITSSARALSLGGMSRARAWKRMRVAA